MTRRAYPKYKDSGVEWVGEIPEHWEAKRLKYTVDLVNEKTNGQNVDLRYFGLENIESWTGKLLENESQDDFNGQGNLFGSGDVLFGKLRPYLAKALRAHDDGLCTSELLVLHPKDIDQNYLFYCILNRDFVRIVDSSTFGAKMPRANWDFIGNLIVQLPKHEEQSQIAAFLDHETSRIDTLISKKERQIELLKEKRSALITHAVTKGLNPNAKMKDSGIEWVGEIPEHWDVKKLKHISSRIQTGTTPKSGNSEYYAEDHPWYTPESFSDFSKYLLQPTKFVSNIAVDEGEAKLFSQDSIFLVGIGATIGKVAIAPHRSSCNQQINIIDITEGVPDYFYYYMKILEKEVIRFASFTTLPIFNQYKTGQIAVCVPPFTEQSQIATFLDRETSRIDKLIDKVQNSIETLKEYRAAIISAAVTGKIDVRDWQNEAAA